MENNIKSFKIEIPKSVQMLMNAFANHGYETYVVGGCVRDSILNRKINDWDLSTNATPKEIVQVCILSEFKYIPTGLKHGTITVVLNNINYEMTTYRLEGLYSDGRHPDKVDFTNSLKGDLARRDFTINALAYNQKVGLVDYYGGLEDLNNKFIRCVGDPRERFEEDNLRRLRAIRFSSQLGFEIEEKTYIQLSNNNKGLLLLSKERIRDELCKILTSENPSYGIRELFKLNMLVNIIPELCVCGGFQQHNKYHDKDVFEHILSVVDNVAPQIDLRLAALLHDIAKPNRFTTDEAGIGHFYEHEYESAELAVQILKRLKFDNKTINKVYILVKYHMNRYEKIGIPSIKKFINRIGIENLEELFQLQIADIKGGTVEFQNYESILDLREKCKGILYEKQPLTIKDLNISGMDLITIGYKPGKEMGEALNYLLEIVLEKPEVNKKDQLIELLKIR